MPVSWSADGRFLLYASVSPQTRSDLWALPMTGDPAEGRKPFPVVTAFEETSGQFSPDGRLLLYQSNESGRSEIDVRAFPGPGGRWQASTGGGYWPRWRSDGKELFYVAADRRLMAVPIAVSVDRQTVDVGVPVALFMTRLATGGGINTTGFSSRPQYVVGADGRFLMNVNIDEATSPSFSIVLNWETALKRR